MKMIYEKPPHRLSSQYHKRSMTTENTAAKSFPDLKDGDLCKVTGGTHAGKSGTVRDIKTSKTGHITITVVQQNGERFKTLGRNVVIEK
jgi:ribosomal protein S4E